jgi:hypothetical protein
MERGAVWFPFFSPHTKQVHGSNHPRYVGRQDEFDVDPSQHLDLLSIGKEIIQNNNPSYQRPDQEHQKNNPSNNSQHY